MLTPSGTIYKIYQHMLSQGHLLIGGTTGSGKSVVLNGLLSTILYDSPGHRSFVLIDPKRVELAQFKRVPHCIGYAQDDCGGLLDRVIATMESRYKYMSDKGLKEWDGGYIYVCIDELADIVTDDKTILEKLIKIGRVARAARIYLIAATQSPNRRTLNADLVLNFPSRLALRCLSRIESRQLINDKGAELLPRYGTGLYYSPDFMSLQRVTIPKIDDSEINRLINHWKGWK